MDILRLTELWEGRSQREPKYNQSIKDIYCHILKTKFKNKADLDEVTQSPNTLFIDLLRLVSCFWVTELESRHLQLSWMEAFYHEQVVKRRQTFSFLDPLTPNPIGSLAEKVQADLISLHGIQIDTGPYHYLVGESLINCQALNCDGHFTSLIKDLQHLQEAIDLLESRVKRNEAFLRSICADFEKERSDSRNKLVLILALWAWLVSPVTLTSSIMNLGVDKGAKSSKVGDVTIFWKVAVVLGISVVLVVVLILWVTEAFSLAARRRSSLVEG
jgi:hypothetical protein